MNKKQRQRNRQTAAKLSQQVRAGQLCPECGLPCEGGHWVTIRHPNLEEIVQAQRAGRELNPDDYGFWTCAKFYDPVTQRRLEQYINPLHSGAMTDDVMVSMVGLLSGQMDLFTSRIRASEGLATTG